MAGDAVGVAVSVARTFGMSGIDPDVLANGSNAIVHLRPYPVVARVATLTAELRAGVSAWLARDVAMSAHAAARGVPVVRPCVDPPAGPHTRDGWALTFFDYVPHDPDHRPDPVAVGRALAVLHDGLRDFPGKLPLDGPIADMAWILDTLERERLVAADELAVLRADQDRLVARVRVLPVRPLHGDTHPGNLLSTPSGLVWNDFEDSWRGPLAWDVACLANTTRLDGRAALAGYPALPPAEEIEVCVRLRRLFGVGWRFVLDARLPGRAPDKRAFLDAWLAGDDDVLA